MSLVTGYIQMSNQVEKDGPNNDDKTGPATHINTMTSHTAEIVTPASYTLPYMSIGRGGASYIPRWVKI